MNLSAIIQLLLSALGSVLPGAYQNQAQLQQQTSQRQLSASDFANNPNQFIGRLGNLLGQPGAASNKPGGGVGGIQGLLQSLIGKSTGSSSQGLVDNIWQQIQPQLASSGLSQAPGIANEMLTTALAPNQIAEQQLGAEEGTNAFQSALNTETSNLKFPFDIGSNAASGFPNVGAL